jgi:hypothetical protein
MKKTAFLLCLMVLLPFLTTAQILDPVKWSFKVQQTSPGEATLLLIGKIDPKWHLYSQHIDAEPGKITPLPTSFKFEKNPDYELIGEVLEPKPIEEYDPLFELTLRYFADKTVFKQKIRILGQKDFTIKGILEYMACDDKQCIPPTEVEFAFSVKGNPMAGGRYQFTVRSPQSAVHRRCSEYPKYFSHRYRRHTLVVLLDLFRGRADRDPHPVRLPNDPYDGHLLHERE